MPTDLNTTSQRIHAFTYELRERIVPGLNESLIGCGAWILHTRTLPPNSIELQIELPRRALLELYATLAGAGIELTRDAHQALAGVCAGRKHLGRQAPHLLALRLEIRFLEDAPLHAIFSSTAHQA